MKKQFIIVIVFIMIFPTGCFLENDKLIRKEIENGDIKIIWFYYSHITNHSTDFIEVEKNGEVIQVMRSVGIMTDFLIEGDTIRIKFFEPERGIIYGDSTPTEVFGYKIVLDSTATLEEYRSIPKGRKK